MAQHGSRARGQGVDVNIHGRGQTVEAVAAVEGVVVSGIFANSL